MKKILITLFFILWACTVFAIDWGAPTGQTQVVVATPPERYITLLDASVTTGMSAIKDLGMTPKETKCFVTATVLDPSNFVVAFYAGPNTTDMWLAYPSGTTSNTITSFPTGVSFVNGYGDRYWKVNYVSRSGGGATSAITVKCTGLK